jgi:putative phage-type endonuclease
MPITDHQRELRRRHIGASDAPAIVGVDPWRNLADVVASKIHEQHDEPNDAMRLGNLFEPVILQWAADRLNCELDLRNLFRVSKGRDGGIMAANHDAWIAGEPHQAMEAKFTSLSEGWGEEETDQVPDRVVVQCQHQMHVSDLEVVWVPVLIATVRPELRIYKVERHQGIIDALVDQEVEVWNRYVVPKVLPENVAPAMEVLKRLPRQPNKVVPLDGGLVDAWAKAREYRLAAEKAEEGLERLLIHALGDAEGGDAGDGRLVTYLESKRKGYTVEESTFRTLKIKKPKGE